MKGGNFRRSKLSFILEEECRRCSQNANRRQKKTINPSYLPTIPSFRSSSGSCRVKKKKRKIKNNAYIFIYKYKYKHIKSLECLYTIYILCINFMYLYINIDIIYT